MLRLEVFYPCKNPWRWKETLMDNNEEVIASFASWRWMKAKIRFRV